MKILVVHEVSYLSKIIYEFQILPEILSMMDHDITIVDYDDTWASNSSAPLFRFRTQVHERVHRAYPAAAVTVRRPGMLRVPIISRISAACTTAIEVERVLRRVKPDVILLYGLPTVGVQTLVAAKAYGIPIIFRSIDIIHQLVPYRVLVSASRALEYLVYRGVDGILAVTPHLKKYVQSFGVAETDIVVLPSGVDAEMFSPGDRNHVLMRQWDIEPHHRVIFFMGTIYRFSGLDYVIHGFPNLLQQHPDVRMLVAGVGEDEPRLKQLAAESGLTGKVIFTGFQPYSQLPDLIRSSDICINPFELNPITRDILPTKLFQYLACGKPVLATELPGTLPFLAGERHGIVYAPLEGFMESLADLLGDTERRLRLGRNGEDATRRDYDWRSIAAKLIQYIEARSN